MPLEENRVLIREFLETLRGKDKPPEVVEKYTVDEALKKHIQEYNAAFPRYELAIEDMIAEGDKVAVRLTFRGTHKGELLGIPPTGKSVEVGAVVIYQISNRKIVGNQVSFDALGMMQQLAS